MRIRFNDNIQNPKPVIEEEIKDKEIEGKGKVKQLREDEMRRANNILERYSEGNTDICKGIYKVYAIEKTTEDRLGITRKKKKKRNIEMSRKTGKVEILKKSFKQ